MQQVTVTIDWERLHKAAEACDKARRGSRIGSIDGVCDVFGGTYPRHYFEGQGLAGVVKLSKAADTLAHQAWEQVHRASRELEKKIGNLRAEALKYTQAAVRVALAVHELMTVLAEMGVNTYDPKSHICGQSDGMIHLTGLRWLLDNKSLEDRPVSVDAAQAFADHGLDALHAAIVAMGDVKPFERNPWMDS